MADVNPVYTLAEGEQFAAGLAKAKFFVFSMKNDETASKKLNG